MIPEADHRLECFDEPNSAPVVLADGQVWYLPKPWQEIRPIFKGGRAGTAYPILTVGPELDALIDTIGEAEDFDGRVAAVATLAAQMLLRQYQLADEDLDGLLCYRIGDEASGEWMAQVIAVATGRSGPKV